MKTKVIDKRQVFDAVIFLLLSAAACFLVLFFPLPRQIGLSFRNTLWIFPILFLIALGWGITQKRFLNNILLVLLFTSVLLPYSGLINSGASDQYALGGVIPWSDAFTMQLNTQRFLYGGTMGQATAIRPLSTIFYAVFLHIFDNNYFALQVFLCILTALLLLAAMDTVNKCFGAVSSATFFTILYFYIRQRLGTFMTEPFGFICGLLSCQLILTGIQKQKQIPLFMGFLILSIGLNARPAAMFLFPALGLWYFFIFLKGNKNRLLYSAFALVLLLSGFMINRVAQIAVYGTDSIPNRQAAEMVYGLCLGGQSWGDVVGTPEMIAINRSDNVISDLAGLCAPILKEHPENILKALKTIFIDSLIHSEYYGAFSFVNGNPKALQIPFRYFLMLLWVLGLITLIINRKKPAFSFLLFCVLGIILSECAAVPFSTNYLRLYAVSMWIPSIVTGIFPQLISRKFVKFALSKSQNDSRPLVFLFSFLSELLILITVIIGPFFLKNHPLPIPEIKTNLCSEDEDVLLTSIDFGSFIYLDEKANLVDEYIPYFRLPYVRQHFHDTASIEMFDFTDAIDFPTAIIRGIDLSNYKDALIFAPLELVEGHTGKAQFCGKFIDPPILRNDRFFIPSSVFYFEDFE